MKTPFLQTEILGAEHAEHRVILLVQHDGSYERFIQKVPEYEEACPDAEVLSLVSECQRDIGTLFCAQEIAEQLILLRKNLQVIIVHVELPRTVVDVNRKFNDRPGQEGNAIWNSFNPDHYPELYQHLAELHELVQEGIWTTLEGACRPGDVILDLHSMGPDTPPIHLRPVPGNLPKIHDLWRFKRYPGRERKTDLITEIIEEGVQQPFTSKQLVEGLRESFTKAGIRYALNDPYRGRNFLLSSEIGLWAMRESTHYAIVDMVKTDFCDFPAGYDLAKPVVNPHKLSRFVRCYLHAILKLIPA